MFSTMPRIGTSTRLNIAMPLRASISAKSCGVETMTAPASGTLCEIVSWMSPVPGGMSMTRTSRSPATGPIGFAQHLAQSRDDHRSAPDDGRSFIDQKAHRHDLETPAFERLDDLAVRNLRFACNAEEARLRGSIDVGIDDADLQSDRLQAEREVGGDSRFADAAFAGSNRDDVLHARNGLCPGALPRSGCGLARTGAVARGAFGAGCLNARMLGPADGDAAAGYAVGRATGSRPPSEPPSRRRRP